MGYAYGIYRGASHDHPLYDVYCNMLARCNNQKNNHYHYYGGRGIKVCERWDGFNGFKNFISDMGEKPEGYSLDRINVNGNYEPKNCRWANKFQQASNQQNSKGYPGVSWHKQRNKWRARIKLNRREIYLGVFSTEKEAVIARKAAEKRYEIY